MKKDEEGNGEEDNEGREYEKNEGKMLGRLKKEGNVWGKQRGMCEKE